MSWHDFLTATVLYQTAAFAFTLLISIVAYRKDAPRIFWAFLAGGAVFTALAAWQGAAQDYANNEAGREIALLTNAVTGGDSFPVVVPQDESDVVPLSVQNYGNAPLSGLTVDISCDFPQAVNREMVGTLPAHSSYHLLTFLFLDRCRDINHLMLEGEPAASWWITMTAQNGTYVEIVEFKRGANCKRWSYRLWVEAGGGVGFDANHQLKPADSQHRLYTISHWVGNEDCSPRK